MPNRRESGPFPETFNQFFHEHLVRLAALAEAKGLDRDRASAAAARALLACRAEVEGGISPDGLARLYREDLARHIFEEVCAQQFQRLATDIERRYHLDHDHTNNAANEALVSWWIELDRHGRLADAIQYLPMLYGRIRDQRAIDEIRPIQRQLNRHADLDAAEHVPSATPSAERRAAVREPLDRVGDSLLRFFAMLRICEHGGRFGDLRRLARMEGCMTLAEQFLFMRHFLFENTAEAGQPARRALLARLGWPEKGSTLKRRRDEMKEQWEGVRSAVFRDSSRSDNPVAVAC